MARAAAAACFLWPYLLWRHPQARWRDQLRLPSTALVAAAAGGHLEVLTFLLGQGGADAKEEDGTTPLMAAAEAGSVECVGKLLEGLSREKLGAKDAEGRTALLCAAGSPLGGGCVQKLVGTNLADPAAEDSEGNGALALAARAGNMAAIETLWDPKHAKSAVGTKASTHTCYACRSHAGPAAASLPPSIHPSGILRSPMHPCFPPRVPGAAARRHVRPERRGRGPAPPRRRGSARAARGPRSGSRGATPCAAGCAATRTRGAVRLARVAGRRDGTRLLRRCAAAPVAS